MDWKDCWDNERLPWHMTEINPILQKHIDKLTGKLDGAKLFFPLCGKALELVYMSQRGHSVVGVEYAEKAVKDFFEENKLPFTKTSVPGMILYENAEHRIKIYCGDFFDFCSVSEKNFDGVWDRGSLEAIDPAMREKYGKIINAVVRKGGPIIVETPERESGGPPFHVPVDELKQVFGLKTTPELIGSEPPPEILVNVGVKQFNYYYFQKE